MAKIAHLPNPLCLVRVVSLMVKMQQNLGKLAYWGIFVPCLMAKMLYSPYVQK